MPKNFPRTPPVEERFNYSVEKPQKFPDWMQNRSLLPMKPPSKLTVEEMCRSVILNMGPGARVQLVVASARKGSGRGKLLGNEGPMGQFLGEVSPGRWLVDIEAQKVLDFLEPKKPSA